MQVAPLLEPGSGDEDDDNAQESVKGKVMQTVEEYNKVNLGEETK